jgi:hypothetical protein
MDFWALEGRQGKVAGGHSRLCPADREEDTLSQALSSDDQIDKKLEMQDIEKH